jgi:hypothetical protein
MDFRLPSRARLIATRWLSLLACGVVAAAVVLLLEPVLLRLGRPVADLLVHFHPVAFLTIVGILLVAICWPLAWSRLAGFVGLEFLRWYPPVWVAVLIGVAVWTIGRIWVSGLESVEEYGAALRWFASQIPAWQWAIVIALVFGAMLGSLIPYLLAEIGKGSTSERPDRQPTPSILQDLDALRAWLRDDAEIASPDTDLFDHDLIARRMAARLRQPEVPTMALVGPVGSGKSSIRRLVQYHLRHERDICVVSVSLWPYDSPEAAARGILQALVRGLAQYVNVLPLVGFSDDYVAAIESSAGRYGSIARLLRGTSEAAKIVERFSKIACAAGIRVVLWVEDLERFSGGDQLQGQVRDEREVERLGPIRALLYLLDQCAQISVVISDTSLRTRFDLEKIARFVERIPSMPEAHAWRPVETLRARCLGGHPISVIDAASPGARNELTWPSIGDSVASWLSAFDKPNPGVPVAVVRLLRTPRVLKSALRLTLEAWEAMPGEIDFDSVLVASVLRVARPNLFALVDEHIELFRHGLIAPFGLGEDKGKPHAVVERIEKMLEQEEDGRVATAIKCLLAYLFPEYPPRSDVDDRAYVDRPQAVHVDRHTNYWRRYMAQIPVAEHDSDQSALRSIAAWQARQTSDLVERLIDPARSSQIETFVGRFRADELCRLLTEVADRLSGESASNWIRPLIPPGVASIWRMMHCRRPPEEELFRTVRDLVRRFVAVHLRLACGLCALFASRNPNVPSLLSSQHCDALWETLRRGLFEHFTGNGAGDRLVRALRDGPPWVMYWAAWSLDRNRDGHTPDSPFDGWPEVAKVLLDLAEEQPDTGLPVVVPFVTTGYERLRNTSSEEGEPRSVHELRAEFNESAARRLFEFDRLIRLLAPWQVPAHLDEQLQVHCEAAIAGAKRILDDSA